MTQSAAPACGLEVTRHPYASKFSGWEAGAYLCHRSVSRSESRCAHGFPRPPRRAQAHRITDRLDAGEFRAVAGRCTTEPCTAVSDQSHSPVAAERAELRASPDEIR